MFWQKGLYFLVNFKMKGDVLRNTFILSILFLFTFNGSALAQPSYLIKIEGVERQIIDQIEAAGIEVYTKSTNFWIAGASQLQLDFLEKEKTAYMILDREADIGEHYLVWAKPGEEIQSRLEDLRGKINILVVDKNVIVVKGNPRKIEKLASLGFSIKKIHKKPLPLEPITRTPSFLETLSTAYDPLIDGIVNQVNQNQLLSCVNDLSGEDTVLIQGIEDSIKTRFSYSDGITKASYYLKERFEEMLIPVEFDTFQASGLSGYFLDVACNPDAEKVWSTNYYGGLIRTTDGGDYWSLIDGIQSYELYDICRVDDDTLWCVGDFGAILRTTDGGDTWEDKSKPAFDALNFRGCYFENAHYGWVVGDEKVLYTSNGGGNWTEQTKVAGVRLYAIDFVDPYRGWAAGQNGTILHTTDRGTNWNAQNSGTSVRFRSVDFVDQLNGWACGEEGWAVYTTDGGTNWTRKALTTTTVLTNVFFVDGLHGWMIGYDGSVFLTSDLGVNWTLESTGSNDLFGICFANTLTGWATGYNDILKTTDGGQNWFSQYRNLEPTKLVNVVATIQGSINSEVEVLLSGHYDDISEDSYNWAPGADDNASGTVSLLAAAEILKDYELTNTVKFVAFSGEEQGLQGSAAYADEAYNRGDQIAGVLNFDMIAWDGNGDDVIELHCGLLSENQALADLLIGVISDYGLNLVVQKITTDATDRSDCTSFWDYNYPAVLAIEDFDDFNAYYHLTGDRVSEFDTAYYVDFTKAAVAGISILADPFIRGDANSDALINLSDAIYLLNYLFKNGSAPDPLDAADVNCDSMVNLSDVIYLLNYLFRGGLPPGC